MARNNKDEAATEQATNRRAGDDRRSAAQRRGTADRRQKKATVAVERRSDKDRRAKGETGERRKVQRRINEYVLSAEVLEFINAVNEFKSVQQKPFPTWSDVYEIFTGLGYRKP
ncbi:MAG: hypothetical protein ACYTGN_14345 [Planctomycetota bacterium]|jgi:hypothetical protein